MLKINRQENQSSYLKTESLEYRTPDYLKSLISGILFTWVRGKSLDSNIEWVTTNNTFLNIVVIFNKLFCWLWKSLLL